MRYKQFSPFFFQIKLDIYEFQTLLLRILKQINELMYFEFAGVFNVPF